VKRAAALAGLALLLLVALLLLRAAALRSRQLEVAPVPPLEVNVKPLAERLALAVHEPTVSSQDEAELPAAAFRSLHSLLRAAWPRVHSALEREVVADHSLLYTWKGRNPALPPVLLAAHLDVVPVDPESAGDWKYPPFQGVVADGKVWGRGTLDDKASVVCLLEAVDLLLARGFEPERSVLLAFGHDEEVGGEAGALAIAELLAARGTRLAWVVDEGGLVADGFAGVVERPVAVVGIAEKGSVGIGLEVVAPGGHSSTPPRRSAIGELSRAVVALEGNPMPAGLDGTTALFLDALAPELTFPARVVLANRWLFAPLLRLGFARVPFADAMQRSTTAVTIFEAGVKENVLPIRARAVANFRIHPRDTIDTVVEHVRRTVAPDVSLQVGVRSPPRNPSAVSSVDGEGFVQLASTIRAVFPETVVVPFLTLGGTDGRHYHRVSDDVYRFLPFSYGSDALRLAHGTNEHITLENLVRGVRFYLRLIEVAGAGE
jgi:carboxypeptidase PM20D1